MPDGNCSWKDPRFTYADALTGARLVMLPYLIYGLVASLPGMATATLAVMIGTDLVDGRIARALGQNREFGAMLDSTIDFIAIYSVFTALFAIGVLPWWKWLVIMVAAVMLVVTFGLSMAKTKAAPRLIAGKLVGQVQFVYLPFLIVRTFWVHAGWAQTVDDVVFGLLAAAIVISGGDQIRIIGRLLRSG